MLIIKLLSGITFIGSIVWFIAVPDYEPAIAIVTSLSACIAVWFAEKREKRKALQNQSIAADGIGIQAGGDVSVGSIHANRKGSSNAE